jgi:hypothetical protein
LGLWDIDPEAEVQNMQTEQNVFLRMASRQTSKVWFDIGLGGMRHRRIVKENHQEVHGAIRRLRIQEFANYRIDCSHLVDFDRSGKDDPESPCKWENTWA